MGCMAFQKANKSEVGPTNEVSKGLGVLLKTCAQGNALALQVEIS